MASTQLMMMTIASAMASNSPVIDLRFSGGRRRAAKANAAVKIISGSTASAEAAAIGLVGTIARTKSPNGGTGPGFTALPIATFSASAAPSGIGKIASSTGIISAARIDELHRITSIVSTARPASRPARAASAVCAIPVMSSATTSGTTVILRPLSHSVPITSAASANRVPATTPSRMPPTRAIRMTMVLDMKLPPQCQPSRLRAK